MTRFPERDHLRGCTSDEKPTRWTAFLGEDPDEPEPTNVFAFCPVCAAEEFGYGKSAADSHT